MRTKTHCLPKVSLLATLVATSLSVGVAGAQTIGERPAIDRFEYSSGFVKPEYRQAQQQFPNYYIVELEAEPIALKFGVTQSVQSQGGDIERLNLSRSDVQTYASQLRQAQDAVASRLQSDVSGLSVQRNLSIVLNALIVEHHGDRSIKAQLQRTPGVKRVHEHKMYYALMDVSDSLINAPQVWDLIGSRDRAGEGVNVAIIDGGINSGHPMFANNGHQRPDGLPADDYCSVVDPSFCNAKLAVARFYTPTFAVHPEEHLSPEDYGGHGTHVAGTAVGNHVSISYNGVETNFSGVAPGATLYVYKALFNNPAGQGGGSNIMLVQALEDAIADGADVINNSWGGDPGNPQTSAYHSAFQAAEAAGIVMVTAAGNSGPGAGTVGCPACIEEGLAVANTSHGRLFVNFVEAAGVDAQAWVASGNFEITQEISGPLLPVADIDADNDLACAPFATGAFENSIALVSRGVCSFEEKAEHLDEAGAIGMILWNNEPGVLSITIGEESLPSVAILQEAGEAILEALDDGAEPYAVITPAIPVFDESAVDTVAILSSRGPNFDASFLKPDIAAPGTNILSAYSGASDSYNDISGTSMASPHVAGAAALIRQLRPELDATQVKSVLMTSSNPSIRKEDRETPADWFDIGAGRLDIEAAVNTMLAIDTPSIVSTACVIDCVFERTVTNLLDESVEWHGSVSFGGSGVTAELSTDTLTIEANGTATFRLNVDTTYADEDWQFGQVVWTDSSGEFADVRIPVVLTPSLAHNRQLLDVVSVSGSATVGEPLSIRAIARDGGYDGLGYVTFIADVPEGTELADDPAPAVSGQHSSATGVNITDDGLVWSGQISSGTPSATITPYSFPFTGQSLTDVTSDYLTICGVDQGCDEVTIGYSIGNYGGFVWDGQQVDYISISENGLIAIGDQVVGGTFTPQQLPNTAPPHGTLAPLWTDFEIGAGFGGAMHYNLVEDGSDVWFVWEWNDVAEWMNLTGNRYTFSVWFKLGTDEVVFNYVDVPDVALFGHSVGIESVDGSAGQSQYFGGTGTFPVSNSSSRVAVDSARGYVSIDYDVIPNTFGHTESVSVTTERDVAVTYDLEDYIDTDITILELRTTLLTYDGELRALTPIGLSADGDVAIQIATEPENGSVSLSGTEFTYTPDLGFYGSDSFTYRLVDSGENTSSGSTVSITIERGNDAPTAVAQASERTTGGGVDVLLSGGASSDPDGDELTYSWAQLSGASVSLSGANSAQATFTTPHESTTLIFELTVSDGEFTDTDRVAVTVEHRSSRKWYEGGIGALFVTLGLPLIWLRRRAVTAKK